MVVFAAHADTYFYSKSLDADENQHEQLAALFDLHMIEATQNNPYQLNVDACLKDGNTSFNNSIDHRWFLESGGSQPKQTTPVIRKRRNTQICNLNDSLNNNSRSSILDRSFTRSPGVSPFLFLLCIHLSSSLSNQALQLQQLFNKHVHFKKISTKFNMN